ncbi:MAG: BrxA/BrxB family bacilliredoxin [candidate division Zixibacteria bacterium]
MKPLYDIDAVRPMWEELSNIGVKPLRTPEEVDSVLKGKKGTTLVVINSVCGCAAGHARPGVGLALQHNVIPDNLSTVFAGVDRDATQRAREYMPKIAPSSPSVALFKDGELVYMLHRKQIEALDAEAVAADLIHAFDAYCSAPGPSVPVQKFEDNFAPAKCSSTIPKYQES